MNPSSQRSRLFIAASPLQLLFAQLIVLEDPCWINHLWLWALPGAERLLDEFPGLLVPDIWESCWAVDFGARYFRLDAELVRRHTLAYHRELARYEAEMGQRLASLPNLRAVLMANTTPIERFVARRTLGRGVSRHLYEDGLSIYLERHYGQNVNRNRGGLSQLLRRAMYRAFVVATSRRAYFGPSSARYDDIYAFFPAKYSRGDYDGAIVDLSQSARVKNLDVVLKGSALGKRLLNEPVVAGSAVVLGQSLSEDGVISEDDQVELLVRAMRLLKNRWPVLYYKPHPRDTAHKTNRVLEASGVPLLPVAHGAPFELVVRAFDVSACYGIWTASLAYIPTLAACAAYSILPWILDNLDEKGVSGTTLHAIAREIRPQFATELYWVVDLEGHISAGV